MYEDSDDAGAGLILDHGRVMGTWFVSRIDVTRDGTRRLVVIAAWRTPDGRSLSVYVEGSSDLADVPARVDAARALAPERWLLKDGLLAHRFAAAVEEICELISKEGTEGFALGARGRTLIAFMDTLDDTAMPWAVAHGLASIIGEGWAGIDATFDGDLPLREAIGARPGFAVETSKAWQALPPEARRHDLDRHVAWQLTLLPTRMPAHLARRHPEVSRACLETWRSGLARADHQLARDMRLLRFLPPSWVPVGDDWLPYLRIHEALRCASQSMHVHGDGDMTARLTRLVGNGGRWARLEADLVEAAGVGSDGLERAVSDVNGLLQSLIQDLVVPARRMCDLPATHAVALEACAWDAFVGDRNLRNVLAASRAWHAALHLRDALIVSLPGSRGRPSWDPVLPDAEVGEVSVVVLRDVASLRAEGRHGPDADGSEGLAHCVGGYAPSCSSNRARIVSLRRPCGEGSWSRSSTAELRPDDPVPFVAQHRGRSNVRPPEGDARALATYLSTLPGTYDPSAGFGPVREVSDDAAAYDWTIPGSWERVAAWWAPFLPRPLRRAGPRAWADLARSPR